jgi:hypothetical protein
VGQGNGGGLSVDMGEGVGDGVGQGDGAGLSVGLGEGVGDGVGWREGDGTGVGRGVAVPVPVGEAIAWEAVPAGEAVTLAPGAGRGVELTGMVNCWPIQMKSALRRLLACINAATVTP